MFQIMNVAKSAPFALLTIYQKSMYPPKVGQNPPVLANYAKFADHFLIGPREMETTNFTANCAKFAQFANHHCESHEICAILASSTTSCSLSVPQLFTANFAKSAQFANP